LDSWPFGEFACKASEFAKVKKTKYIPQWVVLLVIMGAILL
jgi:hypothetical protein